MKPTVHIVPHTHWDREWYRSASHFQVRLAHLVDELFDLLDSGALPSFLLDGQAIVLDDYALARPLRASGKPLGGVGLECGPWYVLADNLLVSGEAMVRNLIEGGRAVRRYGGRPMKVGYAPDTFGHPAILPTVLAGFGITNAVTWRGFGGGPGQDKDLYRWQGPDGAEVLMIHLPPAGYENGANLETDAAGARERWRAVREVLERRARSPHWLVMNGADHHAAQADVKKAVAALAQADPGCRFAIGSFSAYARAVERWASSHQQALPVITGELREGRRHAWVLQGTHSARLYLKQQNAHCQRLLERVAEPLVAMATAQTGRRANAHLADDLHLSWRTLLENHPHDSICGTSADDVHREMMTRFARVRAMGEEIVTDALDVLIGHDTNRARRAGRGAWESHAVIFNPDPRIRSAVVIADVALFKGDVRVGQQGPKGRQPMRRPGVLALIGAHGRAVPLQELSRRDGYDRLESPRYYPDADAVEWRRVAIWADDLPALGISALRVAERAVRRSVGPSVRPVLASDFELSNGLVRVRVEPDGTFSMRDDASGVSAHHLGAIEAVDDQGDSYTSSPRGRDRCGTPAAVAVRLVHAGPLRGELEIVRTWPGELVVTTSLTLDAGARHVAAGFAFENRHATRRVRAVFPLGERLQRVVADGPFGPVERSVVPVKRAAGDLEAPDPCAPMQRCVSVAGQGSALTVFSDGLPQYQARPDGGLFVTLLRSFEQLSRGDLPERPGHAGWPTPTPDGRCLGPVAARLALMLHAPAALEGRDGLEVAAEAFLSPPVAFMRRALLGPPRTPAGPRLDGGGLVFSALKPAESGQGMVLRCYNATGKAVRGVWDAGRGVKAATLCRLDETPIGKLAVARGRVAFRAAPRAVVTILVK